MSEHIDEIILHRLRKLRTSENSPGSTSGASSSTSSLPPGNKRSAAEQVEDLLKQLSDESKLDTKLQEEVGDIDALISTRLEKLKSRDGFEFKSREASTKTKPAPRLLLTAAEYDDLSAGTEFGGEVASEQHYSSEEEDSDNEYDTCALCDGKPTIICIDCFKDSYCSKCFAEYHAEGENHKTMPYRKKK